MNKQFYYIFFSALALILILFSFSMNETKREDDIKHFELDLESTWVDSVFNTFNLEEKIAQLFMVRVSTKWDKAKQKSVLEMVEKNKIGGVCVYYGTPYEHSVYINQLQEQSEVPLLVAIDAEWGLGMRLDSVPLFPRQMMLGAIQDDTLIYDMAKDIARQCKRLGIHMNLAPVLDINRNMKNPVINSRSFGEDKYNVMQKGLMYMKGLQDNGVIACGKHFPGHGDTYLDSHFNLPIVNHDKRTIERLHLYPFKTLVKKGLMGVMTSHLHVPSYDDAPNRAASLSKKITTDLLKRKINFKGLVITDGLEMKAVSKYYEPGEIEVEALKAGNDILLLPLDFQVAANEIKKAIVSGELDEEEIDKSCKKVLAAKYWAGLGKYEPVKTDSVVIDISSNNTLLDKLFTSSITLLKNNNNILPLRYFDNRSIATVTVGSDSLIAFQKGLERYADMTHYSLKKNPTASEVKELIAILESYETVIVSINNTNRYSRKNFGITQKTIDFINILRQNQKIILSIFSSPYAVSRFSDFDNMEAIIVAYQDDERTYNAVVDVILGDEIPKGELPVSISNKFPICHGLNFSRLNRLHMSSPEKVLIPNAYIMEIDSIISAGIKEGAYPGCQVLIAEKGEVFYNKSFGYHTYDSVHKVENSDIYDLASVTKIAATTLSIMKLHEEGEIDINDNLGKHLPFLMGTNKESIKIKELMTHQAGLCSWIPFYLKTITENGRDSNIYKNTAVGEYSNRVAENMYISNSYQDTLMKTIIESEIKEKKKYKYSDLGFYLLLKLVEVVSDESFDEFVMNNFYIPMGLKTMRFTPRNYFSLDRIVPTEDDVVFRKQMVHGDVHDPGAAMLGGVAGHAGLFSTSYDIAALMQMFLNNGSYGGRTYLSDSTIALFTRCQYPENENRRGVGFDKPVIKGDGGPACKSASKSSFGHSGFTGIYAWADPRKDLVYVFLSNRICPDAENSKLVKMNIRTEIQQVIYDALRSEEHQVED